MDFLNARGRGLPRHAVTLSRRHFGVADTPVRYVIVIVPPQIRIGGDAATRAVRSPPATRVARGGEGRGWGLRHTHLQ